MMETKVTGAVANANGVELSVESAQGGNAQKVTIKSTLPLIISVGC
jgi:hypothetical protein